MKKVVICLLSIFMVLALCSCSKTEEKAKRIHTETKGNLQITYTYNGSGRVVISKNVYDINTGITTEYFYFYEDRGWGEQLVGVSVVTIDKDGQIIGKYDDK